MPRRLLVGTCALLVLSGLLPLASASAAIGAIRNARANATSSFVTLSGLAPAFASPGLVTVTVMAEPPSIAKAVKGQPVSFITVVPPVKVADRNFSVTVPYSPAVKRLARQGNGNVNLMVVVQDRSQMSIVFTPADPSWLTHGHPLAVAASARPMIRLERFPKPWSKKHVGSSMILGSPWFCVVYATYNNRNTRIGELHVAGVSWMEGIYSYTVQADSIVDVGYSTSPNSNWTLDGSIGITNSLTKGGTLPRTGPWDGYVNDHMDYKELQCAGPYYLSEAVSSSGDTYDGTNIPPGNPYGTCQAAIQHGWSLATVPFGDGIHPGTWTGGSQRVSEFSFMTTVFGFNFGGATGWTTTNSITWNNNSTTTNTYVCGDITNIQAEPVYYNDLS